MNKRLLYIAVSSILAITSCEKTIEFGSGDTICVQVSPLSVDVSPMSKAEITQISDIYLTETQKGKFTNRQLLSQNLNNGIWNTGVEWESGGYTFYGYAYSAPGGTAVTDPLAADGFTITQPTSLYDANNNPLEFTDFLISYPVIVEDGSAKPLVTLDMEHVTSKVELYFVKPADMEDIEVTVIEAGFKNIRYNATYTIDDFTADNIRWSVSPENTYYPAEYKKSGNLVVSEYNDGQVPTGEPFLSFLACQQEMSYFYYNTYYFAITITITVTYTIQEDVNTVTEHTVTFDLTEVEGVSTWECGTCTRYVVVLDSSVRLYGSISDWKDGGEMEGTFVP